MRRPAGVRAIRMRATDVLGLLANGLTPDEVLSELSDLEPKEI